LEFIEYLEKRWQNPDAKLQAPFALPKSNKPIVDPMATINERRERQRDATQVDDEYAGGFNFESDIPLDQRA
jgi:hypothetical protein